jgi:hypothetical protein
MKLTPETEQYLDTLDMLSKQFDFYELESRKLDKEAAGLEIKIDEDVFNSKLEEINKKMEELYVRYQKDRKIFIETIKKVKNYFFNKYGVVLDLDECQNGL